jgi:hypothetical protein
MKRYKSSVYFLLWEVPVACMWCTNLKDAKKSEDLILLRVKKFWRPFCRVKWVDV